MARLTHPAFVRGVAYVLKRMTIIQSSGLNLSLPRSKVVMMPSIGPDDDFYLSVDAMIRSVAVNSNSPHTVFLGAGASINSGVPSASRCIWQWKRDIVVSNNPTLARQLDNIALPDVQRRVQRWLDGEGTYPPLGSSDEYGYYVERCYPIADDRRQYFQSLAELATPFVGYRFLCLLAEADVVTSVWTTNFDGLVVKSAARSSVVPLEVGLDTTTRVRRTPRRGELLCVQLHGDYRYDSLKNTPKELQEQDADLREALVNQLANTHLVMSGYSGRDANVMAALTDAYRRSGTGRLFWCGYEDDEILPAVEELLRTARANGRLAYYVPTRGFDDLFGQLALGCLRGTLRDSAQSLYAQARVESIVPAPPFEVGTSRGNVLIKSNALQIQCPSEVLQFDVPDFGGAPSWQAVQDRVRGHEVVAGLLKGKVLALGTIEEIKRAFSPLELGLIQRSPIDDRELTYSDGVVVGLLTAGLTRSIAASRDLETDMKGLVWEKTSEQTLTVRGERYRVHSAALLCLRRYRGLQYLIVKPTIRSIALDGSEAPEDIQQELRRLVLTKQYNRQFNDALNTWIKRLFEPGNVFEFPPDSGSPFSFTADRGPALATVSVPGNKWELRLKPGIAKKVTAQGIQFPEPRLAFCNRDGSGPAFDSHAIRGITQNRPYDFALTAGGLAAEVRVGVVCPAAGSPALARYLGQLHQTKSPDSKIEYLLEYPGFASAFGTPLMISQPNDGDWSYCREPAEGTDPMAGGQELGRLLTRSIGSLVAARSPSVVVVYIPARWQTWERYHTGDESFDLHDYVKAFCVQQGIPTQFIREATLTKPHQCEVFWWLALSLYAKSMRTPWVLQDHDSRTAFMGLGFSVDATAGRGNRVVLGCSHLYNGEGLGLRYRLSKIENPIIRGRNPFMSRADARRMGENARRLFYESGLQLPERVVIHKRTPFLKDEREGLLEGLDGVGSVDMLEVTLEPALRYVASRQSASGAFEGDAFPVRRGTAIVLENRKALLWVHGTADAVTQGRNYYQGKSRIPAPLVVTRHYGESGLSTVARELLGLSKMKWNSFDMYTKLPTTIESSGTIARIGALLERFGSLSYDYRLFI